MSLAKAFTLFDMFFENVKKCEVMFRECQVMSRNVLEK